MDQNFNSLVSQRQNGRNIFYQNIILSCLQFQLLSIWAYLIVHSFAILSNYFLFLLYCWPIQGLKVSSGFASASNPLNNSKQFTIVMVGDHSSSPKIDIPPFQLIFGWYTLVANLRWGHLKGYFQGKLISIAKRPSQYTEFQGPVIHPFSLNLLSGSEDIRTTPSVGLFQLCSSSKNILRILILLFLHFITFVNYEFGSNISVLPVQVNCYDFVSGNIKIQIVGIRFDPSICYNNIMKNQQQRLEQSLLSSQTQSQIQAPQDSKTNKKASSKMREYLRKLPTINGSNIFSTLFFAWLYPFLSYGSKTPVTVDSMPKLPPSMSSESEFDLINQKFKSTKKSSRQGFTLIKILAKTYYCQFFTIMAFLVVYVTIQCLSPWITALIMNYISHKEDYESYYGYVLFGVILLLQVIKSLCETHLGYNFTKFGINITNNLTLLIFTKSLRYQSITEKTFTESDIINYSQVDAQRLVSTGFQLSAALTAPPQIIVGIVMMYYYIGISFLAGIGVMLLTIVLTYITAKRSYKFNKEILRCKDQRMKITQEILDIIRYIKINAIEKFFYNRVDDRRKEEIKFYKKQGFMDVLNIFIFWSASPLILSFTFITYILLGNQMNSEVAFTTIMIFTTLQYPIRLLPNSLSTLIQMFTSIKRIQKFLFTKEIESEHMICGEDQRNAVVIERGNFYYGVEKKKEEKDKDGREKNQNKNEQDKKQKQVVQVQHEEVPESSEIIEEQSEEKDLQNTIKPGYTRVLKDINTSIKKGSFTMIIGDIGSGKSSILMAILNEMLADKQTRVSVNGSIAYSSQKPWIMSATVKDNITFESVFDQQKFNKTIYHASLEQDMKILPFGVETQIGQKGINISGGQKARIGLARAIYADRDIYLLDDVLSAVDVHVGEFLMRQTLKGCLRGKTIIMPTHAIKFAQMVDEIIIMEKGRIVRKGHFNDISGTEQFRKIFQHEQQKRQSNNSEQKQQKVQQIQKQIKEETSILVKQKGEPSTVTAQVIRQLMLPQDQEVGDVNYKIFKEYLILNGGYFNFGVMICLAMTLWMAFSTGSSIIMERWCEDPLGEQYDLYLYVGLSVGASFFILFRAYKLVMSSASQGYTVHKKMIKALLYASLGDFFNRVPAGRIINRLTKDLRELDQVIAFKIGNLLADFFRMFGDIIICVYGSTPLVLIPLLVISYISNKIKRYYMKSQIQVARYEKSTNSPIVSGFISAINGLSTIRAYKLSNQFLSKQITNIDKNKRVRLTKTGMESWFSINLTYLSFFVNMASIGYCMLSSNTNAALAGLLMNYAINLSSDIIEFTNSVTLFQAQLISLQRIYSFMNVQPEPAYLEYCQEWKPQEQGFVQIIKSGEVEFKEMKARYRSDLPDVLKGMNLKIKAGEKVGIVGRTGAGKTTIINTLLRVTQISGGQLLIDGTKIQDYSLKNFRYGITMIDQEPTLITSSFRQNLDITGSYTDQQLLSILKECNLYETIMEKGGLGAPVSNDSLSAGEKQLLCICRAFLKRSKIVLVDQATANIDVKNDAIIQKVIGSKFKECTVLTVAHRLSTLSNSDKILVMENGEVVEFGSPSELEAIEKGFYREMVLKNSKEFLI